MATEVNKILLELEVDAKGVVKNLDQVQSKLKGVGVSAENVGKQFSNFSKGAKQGADSAGIAGAAAAELGRTISDLPFGINAVTNNISQLGSMFSLLVVRTGSVREAMKSLLAVFKGPAGALIIFQIAVAAVELFSQAQRKAKKDVDETTKTIDLQSESIERLVAAFDIDELIKKMGLLQGEDGLGGAFTSAEANLDKLIKFLRSKSPEFKEAYDALTPAQQEDLDLVQRLIKDYNGILDIRQKIKTVQDEMNDSELTASEIATKRAQVVELEMALFERLEQFKPVPRENLDVFDEIIGLSDSTIERLVGVDEAITDPITGWVNFRKLLLEQEIDDEMDAMYRLQEIADMRRLDKALESDDDIAFYELKLEQLTAFLQNEFLVRQLSYEEYERLKLQERQLDEAVTNAKIQNAFAEINARQQIINATSDSLGSLSSLFGEATAASKGFALAQIAFDVATGYTQGLAIAQQTAKAAGPGAAFAFPIFYAQQIAAVLAAAGKAKDILSKTKGAGGSVDTSAGGARGSGTPQLPSFNVIGATGQNQLASAIAGTQQEPVKAYVVAGEVTTAQSLERNIVTEASI